MANDLRNYEPELRAGGNITTAGDIQAATITATTGFVGSLSGAVSATTISATGGAAVKTGTAVPASAGAVAAGAPVTMFSSGPSIYVTSDVPAFSAVKGSLCINTAGSTTNDRLYVNNGTTNWVAITTAS